MRIVQSQRVKDAFLVYSSYHEKDYLKAVKAEWNPAAKCWFLNKNQLLRLLESNPPTNIELSPELEPLRGQARVLATRRAASMALSRATSSNIEVPTPEGLTLRPYQKAAVEFAELHNGRILLADEMGTGKTIEILSWLNLRQGIERVVVVCKAIGKRNWEREIRKWLIGNHDTYVADGNDAIEWIRAAAKDKGRHILVINYDILNRYVKLINSFSPDLVVLDEAHFIKNHKAQRTRAALTICRGVPHVICATGTPIYNRVLDIWKIVHLLDPVSFPDKAWFLRRYFNYDPVTGLGNCDYRKSLPVNVEELHARLSSSCMMRRLKSEVLHDLPSKIRTVIELKIDAQGLTRLRKAEEELVETLSEAVDASQPIYGQLRSAIHNPDIMGKVFEYVRKVGEAKAPTAAEFIDDLLEELEDDSGKVVVFTRHHSVTDYLRQRFPSALVIDGRVANELRDPIIQRFNTHKDARLFIGSIDAAGDTINLTAASTVVFVEQHYSPFIMAQAEDRCHRIGQKDSVNVYIMVLDGSYDVELAKELVRKATAGFAVLDGATTDYSTETDTMATVLANIIGGTKRQNDTALSYNALRRSH